MTAVISLSFIGSESTYLTFVAYDVHLRFQLTILDTAQRSLVLSFFCPFCNVIECQFEITREVYNSDDGSPPVKTLPKYIDFRSDSHYFSPR